MTTITQSMELHDKLKFWIDQPAFAARVDEEAAIAASIIRSEGHALIDLEPGDMTRYRCMFVHVGGRLYAGYFEGGCYEVPKGWLAPDYVAEKWLAGQVGYTANVLARFFDAITDGLNNE